MSSFSKNRVGLQIAGVTAAALAAMVWLGPKAAPVSAVRPVTERTRPSILQFPRLDGGAWQLEQHRGQVVLLNFWATWCPPCRAETPSLIRIAREYGTRGLVVAGVGLDEDGAPPIRKFASDFAVPYPLLLPGESSLAANIQSLPTTILFDRAGRAAASYTGAVSASLLERDIAALLKEGK